MEIDEGNIISKGHCANVESLKDEEFFEFEEVESIMNNEE